MKKLSVLIPVLGLAAALLFSCGDEPAGGGGDKGPLPLDTTVVGRWEGAIMAIPFIKFNGAQIFVHISGVDSAFTLVSRDSTQGTAFPIKDTTLVLAGTWRLNPLKDSILLYSDTCRIIDTAQHILVPRPVKGQIIPMPVAISKNKASGDIEWNIGMIDLLPLAPLLNIDLTGVPVSVLQAVRIILVKRSQTRAESTGCTDFGAGGGLCRERVNFRVGF